MNRIKMSFDNLTLFFKTRMEFIFGMCIVWMAFCFGAGSLMMPQELRGGIYTRINEEYYKQSVRHNELNNKLGTIISLLKVKYLIDAVPDNSGKSFIGGLTRETIYDRYIEANPPTTRQEQLGGSI